MKLQSTFLLLLLLAVVAFAGCYTQLGYHASSSFEHGHHYRSVRDLTRRTLPRRNQKTPSTRRHRCRIRRSEHGHDTEYKSEEVERD